MSSESNQGPAAPKSSKRRGFVLVAVLVVVASLSLAAYQFTDMMTSEYKASANAQKMVQARASAESGIYYAAALLSNPQNFVGDPLNGNPFNNPTAFQGILVQGEEKKAARFSIIAPSDADTGDGVTLIYGVQDESAKININALMIGDPTGQGLHTALMALPNMTDDIAYSIVAYMGGSVGQQNNGAGDDYYMGQSPPYRCKNGPLDSIDELLLVRGVTRDLLYGADLDRNGVLNGAENAGAASSLRGWSQYLTVHSREPNAYMAADGKKVLPRVWLNNPDLTQLVQSLQAASVDENLIKFIFLYRQKGPYSPTSGGTQSLGATLAKILGGGNNSNNSTTVQADLESYKLPDPIIGNPRFPVTSLFDLVNQKTSIQTRDNRGKITNTVYTSPLTDGNTSQADLFAQLYACCTLTDGPEIPARVNINTAPQTILKALPAIVPTLQPTDIDKIIAVRPAPASGDPLSAEFSTPLWLWTKAQVSLDVLRGKSSGMPLDTYITTHTQVYRVQSVGYFDGKGPAVRLEAVIDTNWGRPRILAWRDLSELGRGMDAAPPSP